MHEEMWALKKNDTWNLVDLPRGKTPVGCKWVYMVKMKPDGSVDRYKLVQLLKVIPKPMVLITRRHLFQW